MKETLIATMSVLLISLLSVGPASAQKNKINIKGEVTAVEPGTLTVASNKGETYVISVPDDMDAGDIHVGDTVLVKAIPGEGGTWVAISIKQTGNGNDKNGDDEEKPEGFKNNSAFCAEGKQDKSHPLAPKIAERFGVPEDMVMDYFCEGYSIGAIMLAIKTSQLEGVTLTPGEILASRENGNGWGQIWQELGLIGSEKDGHSPPGLLNKPDHAGPKNKN